MKTLETGKRDHPDQDMTIKNETINQIPSSESPVSDDTADNADAGTSPADMILTAEDQHPEDEVGFEKHTISDFQAVAGEFNAAFNTALYELEYSRKQIEEQSARIDELNESIKKISSTLDAEVNKGQRREEEYSLETGNLHQRIRELQELFDKTDSQLKILQEELDDRNKEVAVFTRQVDDLVTERDALLVAGA